MQLKKTLNFVTSMIILGTSLLLLLLFFLASGGYIDMTSEPEIKAETNTTGVPVANASDHSVIDGERLEMEIFNKVNEHRRNHGIDPFVHSERVRLIARLHSFDMGKQGYFNHTSPGGNNPRDRHNQYDGCESPNENIAKIGNLVNNNASKIANDVVSMWTNSSGHNTTQLSDYYHVSGVGVYVTQNRSLYVTMNFCREHPNA